MSPHELAERIRSFADAWLVDSEEIYGRYWYDANGIRFENITANSATPPRERWWLLEIDSGQVRVLIRPATQAELSELLAVLREAGAAEKDVEAPANSAQFHYYLDRIQLSFVALSEMVEGVGYKQWVVKYHPDGRPPSVGFWLETRRGNGCKTLPGAAVLRGNPW